MTAIPLHVLCLVCHLGASDRYFDPVDMRDKIYLEGYIEKHSRCSMVDMGNINTISTTKDGFSPLYKECQFNPSTRTCFGKNGVSAVTENIDSCFSEKWFCMVLKSDFCNGKSLCLMDECSCEGKSAAPIYYCSDGIGCIHISMVCDGIFDCFDGSDELMCDGLADFNCRATFHNEKLKQTTLFKLSKYTMCVTHDSEPHTSLRKCNKSPCKGFQRPNEGLRLSIQCITRMQRSGDISHQDISETCRVQCKDLVSEAHCNEIALFSHGVHFLGFACTRRREDAVQSILLHDLCNGVLDCDDGSDELGCLGRFYCSNSNTSQGFSWIPQSAVCDGVKDCDSGIDECSNCSTGSLSSDQFIIRNHGIFVWLLLSCAANFILNTQLAFKEISSEWKGLQQYVKVDKLLKIKLCFYDLLLGFYLLSLIIAYMRYYGNYCFYDYTWRSSWVCRCLGILYNFSSHGSLLTVFLMSLTRAYKCFATYSRGMSISAVMVISGALALLNIANSVIPVIPTDTIQAIFRVKLILPQSNPFIKNDYENASHINRLYSQYYMSNTTHFNFYQKVDALKRVTNEPSYFDFIELSYYSWSSVCVNDIFGYKESLWIYKRIYISFICLILVSITAFYLVILRVFISSRKAVERDNVNSHLDLKLKLILMIGSKLLPWLTIIGAIIYYNYTIKNVPELWYQVTAICIIPANSLLNPIFSSELIGRILKHFQGFFLAKRSQAVQSQNPIERQVQAS